MNKNTLIYFSNLGIVKKFQKKLIDRLVEESLDKSRKIQNKRIELIKQIHQKKIEELNQSHDLAFKEFQKEQMKLVELIKSQLEIEKKETLKERDKAIEMQKNALMQENKFTQYLLKFQELLYRVKKLSQAIQHAVIAEAGIEELIFNIEDEANKTQKKLDNRLKLEEIANET